MATTSITASRPLAGFALTLLLFCLCFGVEAPGQSTSSLVTSSVITGLTAPATWDSIWDTAVSNRGDFVASDFQAAAVTQFQPGNPTPITVLAPGSSGPGGAYANNGVAIDPWNNMWLDNNWNGGLGWIPYNAATGTWNVAAEKTVGTSLDINGYYYQSAGLAINASGTMMLSTENGAPQPALYTFTIDSAGDTNNLQTVITSLSGRARTLSIDNAGNTYIVEDSGRTGVLLVPAGTIGVANDKSLQRVDPIVAGSSPTQYVLSGITGTAVDAAGNLYIGDSSAGIFMVPNQGGTLNPSAWVMLSPIPAQGQISISPSGDTLFVPTSTLWNGIKSVAKVHLGAGEVGSSAVGMMNSTPITVYYSFSGLATAPYTGAVTPAKFVIQEQGAANTDFAIVSGGTCAAGTTYPIPATSSANAVMNCTLNVEVTPQHVGSVSAELEMLDSKGNVLATTMLHGQGLGANIQTAPALETTAGSGLETPTQIATDAQRNIYVADSGLKQVLMYAAGSGASAKPTSIGTGLTQPTGVAVDGNGDVFIADSGSGSVVEVPYGSSGLNASGQITLISGLGYNLTLAVDGVGHLYIADPANARVVELSNLGGSLVGSGQQELLLTNGFHAPSYVAVDASNNLYVVDGSNLFEISAGAPVTLLNTLSNAAAVAIDPSGAVYVSSSGGTLRIPFVGGVLNPSQQTTIASGVTNPMAVAVDNLGNVYLADGTAENVHVVTANGSLNFSPGGTPSVPPAASLQATIVNAGNASLTVNGYASTNAVDYSATDLSCEGATVAAGSTCQFEVTLNPGPGEQGTLTGQIQVSSTAVNAPIVVDATGISAALAQSKSKIVAGSGSQVIATPVTVTVTPASGNGTPTGQVTVSFPSWNLVNNASTGWTINPVTSTMSANLVNGTANLTLSPVLAGTQTLTISYGGDRVYGRSTSTVSVSVAKSAIANLALDPNPPSFLPFVLENDGSTPYDQSPTFWEYNFPTAVVTAVGTPTGTITYMDNSSTCPAGTSASGLGAATCAPIGYSGVACPQKSGVAVQPLAPTSIANASAASFGTYCLPMPQNVTYTPVISTHSITAVYSGDANFLPFTGTTPTLFQAVRSPAVIISSSPASLTLHPGSTASANLTLASILGYGFAGKGQQLNDYNFPVTLSCSNLPPHTTCSFTYPPPTVASTVQPTAVDSVQIPCTGTTSAADNCMPGNVMVTLNTNVAVGTETSQIAPRAPITFAAMFGFGLVGLFFRRRLGKQARLFLILCMVVLSCGLAASLTACSTSTLSPATVLTTPGGTYAVTITAQQVGTQQINPGNGDLVTIYGSENQVSLPFTLNVTVQ